MARWAACTTSSSVGVGETDLSQTTTTLRSDRIGVFGAVTTVEPDGDDTDIVEASEGAVSSQQLSLASRSSIFWSQSCCASSDSMDDDARVVAPSPACERPHEACKLPPLGMNKCASGANQEMLRRPAH